MLKQEKNEPGARHPDISGLAAQLQRSSRDVQRRTQTARLCTERRHGWMRRRLGLDERYRERDVVVRLSRYDGAGTYDNPAAIITEQAAMRRSWGSETRSGSWTIGRQRRRARRRPPRSPPSAAGGTAEWSCCAAGGPGTVRRRHGGRTGALGGAPNLRPWWSIPQADAWGRWRRERLEHDGPLMESPRAGPRHLSERGA